MITTNDKHAGIKKRKRKDNPLSNARGKQNQAENVWFRRSNAGYRLFVEYYAGQPDGTVSIGLAGDSDNDNGPDKLDMKGDSCTVTVPPSRQGSGMSRAAKRRKKKKKKSAIQDEASQTMESPSKNIHSTESANIPLTQHKHYLLEALEKFSVASSGFKSFCQAMARPLPLTFRLRQSTADEKLRTVDALLTSTFDEFISKSPIKNSNIYQALPNSNLTKESLSKRSPELKKFLITNSQTGNLARQEFGSMLPVLALQRAGYLKASSRVLDVCSSPGSKTLQALELVGIKGRVLANDVSEARLETLKAAVQRSGLPEALLSRITYTCQDASRLKPPVFKQKGSAVTKGWDVAIADVPCSGDGTCRKDKHILPMWKPNHGNHLHSLQLRILLKTLDSIQVGGMVCYSTCSLNPIEDEAVVAAALQRKGDTIELVKFPKLPGFVGRPGIRQWRVADYAEGGSSALEEDDEESPRLRWHNTWQDANTTNMASPLKSMWPPSDNHDFPLEFCTRLWPQDQDTGGFFLALFKRIS